MDTRTSKDSPRIDTPTVTTDPSTDAATLTVSQQMFDAIAERDLDTMVALQHEEVIEEFVALELVLKGRAAVRGFFQELYAAFPDFRIRAIQMTASGATATTQWESWGSFTGASFQGIRATGRTVRVRGVDCAVIDDGRLRQDTIYYDGAGFARDIGLLPGIGGRGNGS
jgi:steroid delta-isomerase-like uncharacterized protein